MVCSSATVGPLCSRSPAPEGAADVVISIAGRRRRRKRQDKSHPQLVGQCCDRLRPSFLRRRLEQILPLHTAAGAALVDWRWDSISQRVSGLVLEDNQLRPFRWWPSFNHFELRAATLQIRPLG
jgi:hypothetical protein